MNPATVMLRQLARATRFNRWMADTVSPFIGRDVLEIGAGTGNLTALLCAGRVRYVATDSEQDHLNELRARIGNRCDLRVILCDAANPNDFASFQAGFDTVICFNVLEHVAEDEAVLSNIHRSLRPGGKAVILVPQGPAAFGSLDEVLDHKRRYAQQELSRKMMRAGFRLEAIHPFNRVTYPAWILNSRILRRRTLSSIQLYCFDLLVPLWRRVDACLPWPPTSLIAIGIKEG